MLRPCKESRHRVFTRSGRTGPHARRRRPPHASRGGRRCQSTHLLGDHDPSLSQSETKAQRGRRGRVPTRHAPQIYYHTDTRQRACDAHAHTAPRTRSSPGRLPPSFLSRLSPPAGFAPGACVPSPTPGTTRCQDACFRVGCSPPQPQATASGSSHMTLHSISTARTRAGGSKRRGSTARVRLSPRSPPRPLSPLSALSGASL